MIVYIILLVLVVVAFFVCNHKYYKFVIGILALLALLRNKTVGADVSLYCANIARTSFNPRSWNFYSEFEDGYNLLIACYNFLFSNPLFFVGLSTFCFIISWNQYNIKKSDSKYLGLILFYMLGYYVQSFNIIRQYFALGLLIPFLLKYDMESSNVRNNIIEIAIIVFIGTFFHNSIYILLLIPLYNLLKLDTIFTKKIYFSLCILTMFVFSAGIIRSYLGDFSSIYFLNDKANAYYQSSLSGSIDESEYSNLRFIFDNIFLLFLIKKTKSFNIYAFLYIMAQLFINLFAPLNVLFVRIASVLSLLGLPYISKIWFESNKTTHFVISIYASIIFVNLLIKNYGFFEPYLFFFE